MDTLLHNERVIISSTHKDLHGDIIPLKELVKMAKSINNSMRKPAINIEHDPTLPPVGRGLKAEIIKGDDGEYYLSMQNEYYDKETIINYSEEEKYIKYSFTGKQFPFINKNIKNINGISLGVDYQNFESSEKVDEFFKEIKTDNELELNTGHTIRKSLLNDPILTIDAGVKLSLCYFSLKLLYKLGEKIVEKIGENIAMDLNKFYNFIKNSSYKIAKYSLPKNRPITYVLTFSNKITIEYIVITDNPDIFINSVLKDKISETEKKIDGLIKMFKPERIQFLYDDIKGWQFNYLITKKGESIGTLIAHEKRKRAIIKYFKGSKDYSLDGKSN